MREKKKDYRDLYYTCLVHFLLLSAIFIGMAIGIKILKKQIATQAEQIKILEQSLSEQITEKEVYMKMLEEKQWKLK